MFTVRLTIRSGKVQARSCLACLNNRHNFQHKEQFTSAECEKLNVKAEKINKDTAASPVNFYSTFVTPSPRFGNNANFRRMQLQPSRTFATDEAPKSANVFGELSDQRFEKFEMDEDEKKEEKFVENEARVDRRYKLTPGGYANLIKSHIQKGDLEAAVKVLELVKQNRDEATPYMYNLLIRAYAVVGDLKKCRSLYTTMKKRGLKCNDATYTSMINVCATYHHSETALDYLASLREEFLTKNIPLNETHYNAMIKAYGRHKNILEAFRIADEMRDKRLPTGDVTFNSLLIGAISDREAGLRYAIIVWHQIRRHKITPTINTYNLMLRAMRDTKLGDLKINDILIPESAETQILLNDDAPPNLLARFPSVNSLVMTRMAAEEEEESSKEAAEKAADPQKKSASDNSKTKDNNLPATLDSEKGEKSLTVVQKKLLKLPLDRIRNRNRLILFGGVTGILEEMERDGVVPDTKTITLLMHLVPPSAAAEQRLIKTAKAKKIPLDLDFYNMLMKKRTVRKDYDGAKEVLSDIQRAGLCPDIITWGVLAMGCQSSEEARTLIEGMHATGHRLNVVIAGTLINVACKKIRFGFVLEMMETMKRHHVKPNWELYVTLDNFQKEMETMIKSKRFTRTTENPAFKSGFSKFNCRYLSWQEEMGRKIDKKEPKTRKEMKR